MDYNDAGFVRLAYWGSNVVGLLIVLAAYKSTRIARVAFSLLFGYAAWTNYTVSHTDPTAYLDYAEHAIPAYSEFIKGWFSEHITIFVTIIAIGQLLISLGMLLHRTFIDLACFGAILFLMGIAPLGYYAAFPFSVTVSIAALRILNGSDKKLIWKLPMCKHSTKENHEPAVFRR